MTEISVRPARMEDVPRLSRLVETSVRGLSAADYDPGQIESSLKHLFGVDTTLIADGTYYVATRGDAIVGCGGWSYRRTPFGGDQATVAKDAERRDPAREPAVIRAFFVHPSMARRGIGREVLLRCEGAAAAAGFRSLELVATRPGEPFYAAFGYQARERMEIPLPDDRTLPAVRMVKEVGRSDGG